MQPSTAIEAVADILKQANRQEENERGYGMTDLGNAERLVARHGDDIRYSHELGAWFVWNHKRWVRDGTEELMRLAADTVMSMYEDVAQQPNRAERDALIRWARLSESKAKLQAMVDLARTLPDVH